MLRMCTCEAHSAYTITPSRCGAWFASSLYSHAEKLAIATYVLQREKSFHLSNKPLH